jgi:multidrug efflux pump subunit AcrA (membrane-fusion protein)
LTDTKVRVSWRLGAATYSYVGLIERTGAEIDSSTGGVVLHARIIEGPIEILRPGAFVELSVPDLTYENIIVLPETAISHDGVVYIVDDSRLVAREVEVVREFGDKVFIKGDLSPMTEIVTEQFPEIGPGIRVRPM